uniref:glutathione gamma-glutamylcysteinyltransferase n=1 Tax=Mantoniella antarctica TaxID=81844 RepID=A0A7S0T5R7_9CHLO|mmetsp:Transcript_7833/g.19402  ORF Transcript_7833/g.19402 Transcript_7833/m.19402 type:complete len:399 (+) Transcript_7833:18-1214(+)
MGLLKGLCAMALVLQLLETVAAAHHLAAMVAGLGPGLVRRSLLPVPHQDVILNSSEGIQLLRVASHALPWHQLSLHFETQRNQAFCSAATSVTILNALGGDGLAAPTDGFYKPFPYFTQRTLFNNACVNKVATHEAGIAMSVKFLAMHGATLHEWQAYLACFTGEAGINHTHASTASADAFRRDVIAAFAASVDSSSRPVRYVGINFHRSEVGEIGGGHMSPIGAYDAATDRVLVMDVSRYKYPPVWTKLEAVYRAMNTTDGASGRSRGWVVVGGSGDSMSRSGGRDTGSDADSDIGAADAVAAALAARPACMAVAGESDWDAVMGCMRYPVVFAGGAGYSSSSGDSGGVSVGAAVLSALVCAVVGGAGVGGAWYYVERQRDAKFRRHAVMDQDFEDI